MGVYSISGAETSNAYSLSGSSLSSAYSLSGSEIPLIPDIEVTPLTWDMTNGYKNQVLAALKDINDYKLTHPKSYAFAQFNDTHEVFSGNEPNFIDYNKGYKILSRMIFIGDMVNNATTTTTPEAIAFMNGASASQKLVGMGNHEFYRIGATTPETEYKDAINATVSYMPSEVDTLAYYNDDESNNIRYIMLDYYYVTRSGADDKHLLDNAQLAWCASVMASAGTKDIIIIGHAALTPFINLLTSGEVTTEYGLQNQQNLKDLINAFQNKSTYSVTVDGLTNTYDFSECTGDFILYTSGHWHRLGHDSRDGFNSFVVPTLLSNATNGFAFFIIDTINKTIKMMRCSKTLNSYETYDYTY